MKSEIFFLILGIFCFIICYLLIIKRIANSLRYSHRGERISFEKFKRVFFVSTAKLSETFISSKLADLLFSP